MPSLSPPKLLNSSIVRQASVWKGFASLSLLWGAGFWLGASLLLTVSPPEAAWAVTLAALFALSSGWLSAEPDLSALSAQSNAATWLSFTTDWTLWLAKLMATVAIALSLASYLLSQLSADAVWLLPAALIAIWGAVLSQKPRSWHPQLIRGLALLSGLGLVGLMLSQLVKIAAGWDLPLAQLPISDSPLRLANLLQMTALLSVAFAGFDSLAVSPELPHLQLNQPLNHPLRRKLLSLAITLGWLLYFGLVIIYQASGIGIAENLAAPFGTGLQILSITPLLRLGLAIGAITAFAGAVWLQISSLDLRLRHLQLDVRELGSHSQWPSQKLMRVGLGVTLSCLALVGEIETLWAFSAFAALSHRALCHWQASRWRDRSAPTRRQYLHRLAAAISVMLAFWLEWQVWLVSLGLIALGLVWRGMRQWSDAQE